MKCGGAGPVCRVLARSLAVSEGTLMLGQRHASGGGRCLESRRVIPLVLATVGVAAVTLLPATTASATAGKNGRIVFARQNDAFNDTVAFTVNPDGSHWQRLLPGSPVECPSWSPDGTKLFVGAGSDGEILNADGSVNHDLQPPLGFFLGCGHWSPNGRRLARAGFGDNPDVNGVYTVRASDDRGVRRLTTGNDDPKDFSPDGHRIVFLRSDPRRPAASRLALFTVGTDGQGVRRITPWGLVTGISASWSPDGRWIAFTGAGAIYLVRADGVVLRPLRLSTGTSTSYVVSVGWSPDGTRFVLSLFLQRQGAVNVYTAHADGSNLRRLTDRKRFDPHDLEDPVDWGTHPAIP